MKDKSVSHAQTTVSRVTNFPNLAFTTKSGNDSTDSSWQRCGTAHHMEGRVKKARMSQSCLLSMHSWCHIS